MASHAARHGRAAGIGIVISWALAFAVALTADVDVEIYDGNNSLDSSDWSSGIGSIIIRPNEHTVGDRIDVTVTDDGSSATLSGDLIIATASQDDDAVVPVDFTVNGADLTFDKSLQITAGDGGTVAWTLENGAAVRFQDVLDDDGDPGGRVVDPYEEGFDPTAFSRINALDNGVPEESASLIQITVDGSSLVFDRHLYIKDETARFGETDDSTLRVTGTGGLVAVDGMLYLDDGRITIDDGGALTAGLLVVGSVDTATGNAITVESGGSLAVAQWFLLGNGTLTVQDSGTVTAGGFMMGHPDFSDGEATSHVTVSGGGSFVVAAAGGEAYIGNGTFTVAADAGTVAFLGGLEVGAGGEVLLEQDVDFGGNDLAITRNGGSVGGSVTVGDGVTVAVANLTVENATLTTAAGSLIGGGTVRVEGGTSHVTINGRVLAGTDMTFTGGETVFSTTSSVVDAANSSGQLAAFRVGGSAEVTVNTDISVAGGADSFALGGGSLTLAEGGSLTAAAVGEPLYLRGDMHFDDGSASFFDDLLWTATGKLTVLSTEEARLALNGQTLTFMAGSVLDVGSGSLTIEDASVISIAGTYRAGYENNAVTMVTATGNNVLEITSTATIEMTASLQRAANSVTSLETTPLQILATDASAAGGQTLFSWNSGFYIYEYALRQNAEGEWGLYVTGSQELSRDQQYENLLENWRHRGKVGNNPEKLITRDFGDVIIAANAILVGDEDAYDSLSKNGRFNLEGLVSLIDPGRSGAGYDSLMLYNGSSLGTVNRVVMNTNAQTLGRLSQRQAHIRHELQIASETMASATAYASGFYGEDPENRVWAGVSYAYDRAQLDDGFAGYKYRGRGVTVGYDRFFGDLAVGGAFSYTGGTFEDLAALGNSSHINTYGFFLYGSYGLPAGWFVDGTLGYAYSDNQIKDLRVISGHRGWNSADYHTTSTLAALSLGYDYQATECLTVTGSLGYTYQYAENSAHTQYFSSATASAATIAARRTNNYSSSLPLTLSASYDFVDDTGEHFFTVTGKLGYAYEFHNSGASGRIAYAGLSSLGMVDIVSRRPGRHEMQLGLGGKYYYNQFEFGLNYDYLLRRKYSAHIFYANAGLIF